MSEDWFYISHSLLFLFTSFVFISVEDIKILSIFKKLFLICVLVLIVGVLLIQSHLNVFSISKTVYIFALPLIILLLNRMLFWLHNKFLGEPFLYIRGKSLGGGYWNHNMVDKKKLSTRERIYYMYYSTLHSFQIFLFLIVFFKI